MEKKLKLYIGCSLTHAPEEFKDGVENLKRRLAKDFEVLEFIGLINGTPADVYHHYVQNCVGSCDLFVGICDFPSLGLGYELGTAIEKLHKPVLAVAHKDAHITRLVLGIDAPGFEFERYDTLGEVYGLVLSRVKSLAR